MPAAVWCCLRFACLLEQLGAQRSLVVGLVQHAGHGLTSDCRDDLGDLVADELVVGDTHDVDSTARLSASAGRGPAEYVGPEPVPGRPPGAEYLTSATSDPHESERIVTSTQQ